MARSQSVLPKVIAIAIPFGLGSIVGAAQAKPTVDWYPTLKKPSWVPPAPIFGQVWSLLYVVMGYASYLVWQHGGWEANPLAFKLYAVQLAFNLLWPVTFFIKKRLGWAQLVNLACLTTASLTANEFAKVEPLAGKLFIPYLVWVGFANLMNYSIWKMNPGQKS
eukprot:jgi/Astpho2/7018/Aster-01872